MGQRYIKEALLSFFEEKKLVVDQKPNAKHQMSSDKRRGPIAAEFQGPGPAAIGLPSLFGSKS